MKNYTLLTALFAAPAAVGLVALAGCDTESDDLDVGTETGVVDPVVGTTEAEIPQATRDRLSQQLENLQERAEAYKDMAEDELANVEGFGVGNPLSARLGDINEAADRAQAAVNSGDLAETRTAMAELRNLLMVDGRMGQMPADMATPAGEIDREYQTMSGDTMGGGMDDVNDDVDVGSVTPGEQTEEFGE